MGTDRTGKSRKGKHREPVRAGGPARRQEVLAVLGDPSKWEAHYREGLGADPDAVLIEYWPDGTVRWASDSLRTVLGWEPDRVVGTRWRMSPPEWQDRALRIFGYAVFRRANTLRTRLPGLRADGTLVWLQTDSFFLWCPDGSLGSILAVIRVVADGAEPSQFELPPNDSGGDLPGQ